MTTTFLDFVIVRAGVVISPDTVPLLSNPQHSYGVQRVEDGGTVAPDGEPFNAAGLAWYYAFEVTGGNEGDVYRYYAKAVVGGVTYYIGRTTNLIKTSALVLGRYCNSTMIDNRYGFEELAKWAGLGDKQEAVDYAFAIDQHVRFAEAYIDDYLRGIIEVGDTVPLLIAEIATILSAARISSLRAEQDFHPSTGVPMRGVVRDEQWALEQLAKIKNGSIVLSINTNQRFPQVVED